MIVHIVIIYYQPIFASAQPEVAFMIYITPTGLTLCFQALQFTSISKAPPEPHHSTSAPWGGSYVVPWQFETCWSRLGFPSDRRQ